MEILEDFSGPNDRMIVKGKRSKRVRPSSSASSSGGGGGEFNHNSLVSSSTTTSTSTEEDEDMAHCLILLARGGGFLPKAEEEIKAAESKFNSRKFTDIATAANGKVDVYVYECKTCSRTFPSFQALGGHRASHKKPKPSSDHVDQKKSPTAASPPPPEDDRRHEQEGKITKVDAAAPPPPTQLVEINKPKLHECSICGSEFASGQALGGHMRRHRPVTTTRRANDSSSQDVGEKTRNVLALDLNLPAPPEDERQDTKFHLLSSNQQSHLVISAAAMVDCHY